MPPETVKRRKYKYADRAAAEDKAAALEHDNWVYLDVVNALVNGTVAWLPKKYGDDTGYYRFGYVHHGSGYARLLVTYYSRQAGQRPHTAVYDESTRWLEAQIDNLTRVPPTPENKLSLEFRQGLYDLRYYLNTTRPK